MASENTYLTAEGLAKATAELDALYVKRNDNVERLQEAISQGDIAENAEYDAAKDEQARIAGRIAELERMVSIAKIINDEGNGDVVTLGSNVELEDVGEGCTESFKGSFVIVGTAEADPLAGKLSNVSPVGKAVMGKKSGETVVVLAPDGYLTYRIKIIAA
ncbi:transcription elongation factor GreA [Succiniclasticum ruminis]|jgi:transcription elongation factor GreA|uniref:Transcription elongation factor GreA n=1 Tax=Succiniclasticum ruminis DSM 9236 TaxID=1123323 RepID=A0A1I1YBH7_9FIRM|nr:transcription elongation factor GreA [Succiniclasticum ruminis]SFE16779.1 transcription elongation factor GreA [Succiniclasticum ruminis DSM 9236]